MRNVVNDVSGSFWMNSSGLLLSPSRSGWPAFVRTLNRPLSPRINTSI